MSNTLAVIRQYVSSAVGDLILGTPDSGTQSTLVDTELGSPRWTTDYFQQHGYRCYIYAGTNMGEERWVYDWDQNLTKLTLNLNYTAAIDTSSLYELHRIFFADEYLKAINLAIEHAADAKYLIDKIGIITTLVASTFEYTLPTDMSHVHQITAENAVAGGVFKEADVIDPRFWRLISPRKLKLDERYYSVTAGKDLRIEGQGRQPIASSDTSDIALPLDWLANKAITFLPKGKIQGNQLDEVYRKAVFDSAVMPSSWPNPRARKVVE